MMSNSVFMWAAVVGLVVLLVVYQWYTRHPTAEDVIRGKIGVQQSDVEGLTALLQAAGIEAGNVRARENLSDLERCWSHRTWGLIDRVLGVQKRFGASGENCVGIRAGRIVSVSLVNHQLKDLSEVAALDALQTLQLREGQITSLAGVTETCDWYELNLASNQLAEVGLLAQCVNLRQLDVSFNHISVLSGLDALEYLQELRASNNLIEYVEGVAGHKHLMFVDLGHNRLSTVANFNNLPNLKTLGVNNNEVESLAGMHHLPQLLVLRAGSNPIHSVETGIIEQFPLLQNVSLVNTSVTRMPEGYTFAVNRPSGSEIMRRNGAGSDTSTPKIDVANTTLVDAVRTGFVDSFDADKITRVESLPPGQGFANGTAMRGRAKRGLSSLVDYEGEIDTLRGTHSIGFEIDRAIGVTFKMAVEEGMVRAYLKDSAGGYFYKETIPGHPMEISGTLITGTSTYFVFLESIDGTAKGIKWSCK